MDEIREDVAALSAIERAAATAGEAAAARHVADRFAAAGCADVRTERFDGRTTYGYVHAAHYAAGIAAAVAGGGIGATVAAAALASLEADGSGRFPARLPLPGRGEGSSALARIPADGPAEATLVIVAHLDAARTGLAWHPLIAESGARRRLARRSIDPFLAPAAAAFGAIAAGSLLGSRGVRAAGAAVLAVAAGLELQLARGEVVPGASDNATGVAAMLALARIWAARPLPGVEVLLVAPGCEESGMDGMRAFVASHGHALDSSRTLVLGLDTLGAGTPIVLRGEGVLRTHAYRDVDLDLADRAARRAGLPAPERWRIGGWTDPVLARFAGLPTISLLSRGPKGTFTNYHRPTDTVANVDWDSVAACLALARAIGEEFAAATLRNA